MLCYYRCAKCKQDGYSTATGKDLSCGHCGSRAFFLVKCVGAKECTKIYNMAFKNKREK